MQRQHARTLALRRVDRHADADRGHHAQRAPAPSQRDGIIDRAAAGIQHDGGAMKFTPACEFLELVRAVGCHDADRADPAAAIRLAYDPVKMHRQFAFFERTGGGVRRGAEHDERAGQSDTKGGGA